VSRTGNFIEKVDRVGRGQTKQTSLTNLIENSD